MAGVPGVDAPATEAAVPLGRLLRLGAASASLAAAAVHASAIAGHAFDALHAGVFVAMTVFQAWWAYLVLQSAARRVLTIGAVGHGLIVSLWLVSRTVGIPEVLPGGHEVEAVGLKDAVATGLAVATVALIDALSRRDLRLRPVRPSSAGSIVTAFVIAVALATVPAVLAAGHHHDGGGRTHAHTDAASVP